jgi:uncharacterized protein YecT (DUF1311 family)
MKIVVLGLLSSLCLLFVAAAPAQKKRQAAKDPCPGAYSQYDMNVCAHKQFQAADAALNRAYDQLSSRLDEGRRAKLKEAELAWLKYRDGNCEFVSSEYEGGSMRPMVHSFCLADVTRARTAELKRQLRELER